MRVTIVADDGLVGVDGVFRAVDLSTLDPNIHAVQWDGAAGHVEHKDRSPARKITDISAFQSFIDAWTAAAPPPRRIASSLLPSGWSPSSSGWRRIIIAAG